MFFLIQDCSFDSLGISSVAVQPSNVLAVFISLSGSNMRPFCFRQKKHEGHDKKRSLIGRFGFGAKGFLKMEPCL